MSTIGRFTGESLRAHFLTTREHVLSAARAGKDVTIQVGHLGQTIRQELNTDMATAIANQAENQLMRLGDRFDPRDKTARLTREAAEADLKSDYKMTSAFSAMALVVDLVRQGPGDGSAPGQRALYELASNADIVGLRISSGTLEVSIRDGAPRGDLNAWYDQHSSVLRDSAHRIIAMAVVD